MTKTFDDIQPGTSWACRFRVETLCDTNNRPINTRNLQQGQRVDGTPQIYEGLGVIRVRDPNTRMLKLIDVETNLEFTVHADATWDYDSVVYK